MDAANQNESRCTVEVDLELLIRSQNGDQDALLALLESHYGLIISWVRRVFAWAEREDVMQEARIGFFEAAGKFDTSLNSSFHALAELCVRTTVYESSEVSPVKRTLYSHYRKVVKAQAELMRILGRSPTLEELSRKAGLSEKQVDNALNVIAAFPSLLEEADGYVTIDDHYDSQLVRGAINQLSATDAEIINRYYFSGYIDREIGEIMGKAEKTITVARRRALGKLRDIITGKGGRKDGN